MPLPPVSEPAARGAHRASHRPRPAASSARPTGTQSSAWHTSARTRSASSAESA